MYGKKMMGGLRKIGQALKSMYAKRMGGAKMAKGGMKRIAKPKAGVKAPSYKKPKGRMKRVPYKRGGRGRMM